MSIGETLTRERQRAGLTVTQVSLQTRIREGVIRAMESDDFTACGGNFYARGHIRSIARVIGIDAEPLVREYDETHGGAPQPVSAVAAFEPEQPVSFRERRSPNWTAAMAVALALVAVYAVVQVMGGSPQSQTAQKVAGTPVPPPVPTATGKPAARPSDPVAAAPRRTVELEMKIKKPSWVRVQGDKGKVLFVGILRPGAEREWTAKKRLVVVVGNAAGVRLTVNGKYLGAPDDATRTARLVFTRDGLVGA